MKIPAMIYGRCAEVNRRTRRMATKMKRGASFDAAIEAEHLVDSSQCEGLYYLNYGDSHVAHQENFYLIYALGAIREAVWKERLPREIEETVFNTCIESAWGVLLLLPHSSSYWVDPKHRWLPFLQAAARFWPELEAQGARYGYGGFYPATLLDSVTTLNYVLGHAGIFVSGIGKPIPPNWPSLVEAYAERWQRGLN